MKRRDLEVHRASSPESALELARNVRFDLVLLDYQPSVVSVKDLIQGLADGGHADHRPHVLLVAAPETIEEARAYVGNGVAAVVSTAAPDEESAQLVHDILGAPRRVGVRVSVRLEVGVEEGGASLAFRQTRDLSATGMLVSTPRAQPVGTVASFRLDLPGSRSPIEGKAQVVRHIFGADAGTVNAVGMRFASFKGDDKARLRAFVDSSLPPIV